MTQEEKQLLLKDLCVRLPYGVKVQPSGSAFPHKFIGYDKGLVRIDTNQRFELEHIKPYLRPMPSMTMEEQEEYQNFLFPCPDYDGRVVVGVYHRDLNKVYDWLNQHHFDYRGLIPMGLALEAKEGVYKTE